MSMYIYIYGARGRERGIYIWLYMYIQLYYTVMLIYHDIFLKLKATIMRIKLEMSPAIIWYMVSLNGVYPCIPLKWTSINNRGNFMINRQSLDFAVSDVHKPTQLDMVLWGWGWSWLNFQNAPRLMTSWWNTMTMTNEPLTLTDTSWTKYV